MSEKSNPEYVPDEAEPWENVPDAVRDEPHREFSFNYSMACDACGRLGTEDDLCVVGEECPADDCDGMIRPNLPDWGDADKWIWPQGDGSDFKGWHIEPIGDSAIVVYAPIGDPLRGLILSHERAVEFAHAVLAEVEIAQRGET